MHIRRASILLFQDKLMVCPPEVHLQCLRRKGREESCETLTIQF